MEKPLLILFVLILFMCVLWQITNNVLFSPNRKKIYRPKIIYDNLYIYCKDGEVVADKDICDFNHDPINIWHFHKYRNAKTILYFHGNYGNMSYSSHIIKFGMLYHFNVLMVDYRGFGKSGGYASINNIIEDGITAYKYLTKWCLPEDIIIWGESMGGCPAVEVAMKYPCYELLLFSSFSSMDDINKYGFKSNIAKLFTGLVENDLEKLCNKKKLQYVQCPIMIVHSIYDNLIPFHCAEINYNSIKHNHKYLVEIDGEHASPKLKMYNLKLILEFCSISEKYLTDKKLEMGLNELNKCVNRSNLN